MSRISSVVAIADVAPKLAGAPDEAFLAQISQARTNAPRKDADEVLVVWIDSSPCRKPSR